MIRLLLIAPLLLTGCDYLLNKTVAVSMLTHLPSPIESGAMSAELADALPVSALANRSNTTIVVGLGEREGLTSRDPPDPIARAFVRVTWRDVRVYLCEQDASQAPGTYIATSFTNTLGERCSRESLRYEPGEIYQTTLETEKDLHTTRVEAPEPLEARDVTLTPKPAADPSLVDTPLAGVLTHDAGTPLEIDWSDAPDGDELYGIVSTVLIAHEGDDTQLADPETWRPYLEKPTFTNAPSTPQAMVATFLDEPDTSADIPGEALAYRGLYFVTLTPMQLSTDVANLGIGSGALAGSALLWVLWVDGA